MLVASGFEIFGSLIDIQQEQVQMNATPIKGGTVRVRKDVKAEPEQRKEVKRGTRVLWDSDIARAQPIRTAVRGDSKAKPEHGATSVRDCEDGPSKPGAASGDKVEPLGGKKDRETIPDTPKEESKTAEIGLRAELKRLEKRIPLSDYEYVYYHNYSQ